MPPQFFLINDLHCIHKTLLDLVEDDDAEGKENPHEHKAVDQPAPADELASSKEPVLKGLKYRSDGVETHQFVDWDSHEEHALGLAEWINYRRGVHPELDQEAEEHLEVAVFGGHRGDDGAEAEGQACYHQYQYWEKQGIPVEMCGAGWVYEKVDNVYDDEEPELDAEAKQVADNVGDGHHQTWEIDLAEDAGVLNEGVGCLGDTV